MYLLPAIAALAVLVIPVAAPTAPVTLPVHLVRRPNSVNPQASLPQPVVFSFTP